MAPSAGRGTERTSPWWLSRTMRATGHLKDSPRGWEGTHRRGAMGAKEDGRKGGKKGSYAHTA
eukprot:6357646-Pyramimonas_sp.AAC.1